MFSRQSHYYLLTAQFTARFGNTRLFAAPLATLLMAFMTIFFSRALRLATRNTRLTVYWVNQLAESFKACVTATVFPLAARLARALAVMADPTARAPVRALVDRVALLARMLLAPFTGKVSIAKTFSVVAHALLDVFMAARKGNVLDWVPVTAKFFAGIPRVSFLALAFGGAAFSTFSAGTVVVAFLFLKFVRPVDVLTPTFACGNFTPCAGEALFAYALPPAAGLV